MDANECEKSQAWWSEQMMGPAKTDALQHTLQLNSGNLSLK